MMRQPLELDYWLVNVFSGSWDIFLFVAIVLIAGLAGRFRMSNLAFGMSLLLFALLLAPFYSWIIVITILLVGLIVFTLTSRWTR